MQEGEISCFNFDETCYAFIRKIYLMEKIGVAISVTSALGEGSAFTLTLPVVWQGLASACEPIVIRRPSDVKSTRKTVLVVDDEPETAKRACRWPQKPGLT